MIGVSVKRDVKMTVDDVRRRIGQRVERGLRAAGDVLLTESLKLVPIDTGALKDSAGVRQVGSLFSTVIIVGYGNNPEYAKIGNNRAGKNVVRFPHDYAIYVHQDMRMKHPAGGQAQFLREPALTKHAEMKQALYSVIFA